MTRATFGWLGNLGPNWSRWIGNWPQQPPHHEAPSAGRDNTRRRLASVSVLPDNGLASRGRAGRSRSDHLSIEVHHNSSNRESQFRERNTILGRVTAACVQYRTDWSATPLWHMAASI